MRAITKEMKVSHNLCYRTRKKILNFITSILSFIASLEFYFIFYSMNNINSQEKILEKNLIETMICIFSVQENIIIFAIIFVIIFLLIYIFNFLFFSFLRSLFLGTKKIVVTNKTIEFRPCKKFIKTEIDSLNLKEVKTGILRRKKILVKLQVTKRERYTNKIIRTENHEFYIFSSLQTVENILFNDKI
jgi:hypothetical protein